MIPATLTRAALAPTPTTLDFLEHVRPGYGTPGQRQVAGVEVALHWRYENHGAALMVARVDLRTKHSSVEHVASLQDVTLAAPSIDGTALVLLDRRYGTDGNSSIVVPVGAIDWALVFVLADYIVGGDTLLAQLRATESGAYGRLVLMLAETRAAALAAVQATRRAA